MTDNTSDSSFELPGDETSHVQIDRGARLQALLGSPAVGLVPQRTSVSVEPARPPLRYNSHTGLVTNMETGVTIDPSDIVANSENSRERIPDDGQRSIQATYNSL